MCLFAVSKAGIDGTTDTASDLIERWDLTAALTPRERSFLETDPMSERDRIQYSWRCEALTPLMWATGLIDELPFPDDCFDFSYLSDFWVTIPSGFWEGVGLRPVGEILDQADLIYRLHWATRDAELNGKVPPAGLHPGVVMERHHALNWLIGYTEADWDDVTTDT